MKAIIYLAIFFLIGHSVIAQYNALTKPSYGMVKFVFRNLIKGQPVVLYESTYTNSFGENFQLNKLKYYVSNVSVSDGRKSPLIEGNYHLINQQIDSSLSFTINVPAKTYQSLHFLLGVDSAANESGAQTGALDPMNDMFWTWQSGYVMFKLEGTSPQSEAVNNKIEYHLGGYKGVNSVLNTVWLIVNLKVIEGKTTTVVINTNINKFWNALTPLKIGETPVCNTTGALAKQIAANCSQMFSIAEVINEK